MSTYEWVETRLRGIELYRDAPSAAQEQRVLDVFREHPALVVEAIEHVGHRFASGQVYNPWAVLVRHVEEAMRPLEEVTATDERDREKRIAKAEQWLRTTGKHFDRFPEVAEELFDGLGGDRTGPLLSPWRSDEALRERMRRLWEELRPQGEAAEAQALERAEAWKASEGVRWRAERDFRLRERLALAQREAPSEDPEPALERDPEPSLT